MREKLIAEVLKMVEESEDIRSLNLRELARRVGCAHTNIYNYYPNMENLLWHAVIPAIEQMNAATLDAVEEMTFASDEERIKTLFGKQVEYALTHEGIYRFVWLEKPPASSSAPEGFLLKLRENWDKYINCLFSSRPSFNAGDRNRIGSVLNSYLHGEICHLIFRRSLTSDREKSILMVQKNCHHLYQLLVREAEQRAHCES